MSSSMALWDYATPYVSAINLNPRAARADGTCARCGCGWHVRALRVRNPAFDELGPGAQALLLGNVPQARRTRALEGEMEGARRK